MPLAAGARLGAYEVLSLIGSGGMGEVYRARDPRLGRDVAIKVLPAAFSGDPDRLCRFEQEARAAAALNHPNILAVYDIGYERLRPARSASLRDAERDASGGGPPSLRFGEPGRSLAESRPGEGRVPASIEERAPYIVSELLAGTTLREALANRAVPVRKAVEYAVQIAHGLAAAHEKGITHRDLKPENLFVTTDSRVKILDFGLAKLMQTEAAGPAEASALPTTPAFDAAQARPSDGAQDRPNTLSGMVLGTVGYMSPEQVRGQKADHRSDIFGFGAILYEMLSGHRAFRGDTPADTMSAILAKDPPELSTDERQISPALARIVDRCLEKSPSARFQTTSDLAFAVESQSVRHLPREDRDDGEESVRAQSVRRRD